MFGSEPERRGGMPASWSTRRGSSWGSSTPSSSAGKETSRPSPPCAPDRSGLRSRRRLVPHHRGRSSGGPRDLGPSTAVGRGRPLRARLLARRSSPAHGTVATTARAAAFATWSGCGIRTRLTRSTRLTSPTCYETRTVRSASSGIVTSTGCSPATSGRDGSRAQASRRMFGRRRTRSRPEATSCSWHGGSPRARGRPRGLRRPRARLAGARRSRRRGTPEALRRGAAR